MPTECSPAPFPFAPVEDRRVVAGEEIQLAFLDPVLHLAAGAVDVLVEGPGIDIGADLADDPGDCLYGAGASVDVGAAKPGRQQVATADDVERQVAIGVVSGVGAFATDRGS